jgi:hypothetical protein
VRRRWGPEVPVAYTVYLVTLGATVLHGPVENAL